MLEISVQYPLHTNDARICSCYHKAISYQKQKGQPNLVAHPDKVTFKTKEFGVQIFDKFILCIKERRLPWRVEVALKDADIIAKKSREWLYRYFMYKAIGLDKEKYLRYFDKHYKEKLSKAYRLNGKSVNRHIGFRKIFEELLSKKNSNFTIIETGTLRAADNWADGQSSMLFYEFISIFGGKLVSIDVNGDIIKACRNILRERIPGTGKAQLVLIAADSVEALGKMDEMADLLYLDSYDLDMDNPEPSMAHHLKELVSVRGIMKKSKDILISTDDNFENIGKGKYVMDWAKKTGQEILLENYQTLIRVKYPERAPVI